MVNSIVKKMIASLEANQGPGYQWAVQQLEDIEKTHDADKFADLWNKGWSKNADPSAVANLAFGMVYELAISKENATSGAPDPAVLTDYIKMREGNSSDTYVAFAPLTVNPGAQYSICTNDPTLASYITSYFLGSTNYQQTKSYILKSKYNSTTDQYTMDPHINETSYNNFAQVYNEHPPDYMVYNGTNLSLTGQAINPYTGKPFNGGGGGGGGGGGNKGKGGSSDTLLYAIIGVTVGVVVYYSVIKK